MDSGYANLQSKIGFIYFCVPECQGRSFEEIDRLFRKKTPLRKFHKHGNSLGGEADITEVSGNKEVA